MTRHCDQQELLCLLDETHVEHDQNTIEHLSDCEHCQRNLEQLAADEWWWSDSRELVAASDADEMRAAGQPSGIVALDRQPAVPQPNWSLDFLEPPAQPDLLGRLGKYHIESVIGHGGMGIVLRGFDTELNRTVAIKVMAPHLASSGTARKRFAREAKAAAAVVHDHVVAIHGIETSSELPYIVMPYVSGASLQKHVEENGPLDTKTIVRIAMQIASGLAAAHEQGLVHRDIKPANILLENNVGRVLITDFGLARAADDASITRSGLVAGTPHYMSPEQANGEGVDQRSDLFSLGSVIYFMATGRAPFHGDGAMAVLHSICHKEPTRLRQLDPEIPRPLEQLASRLLSKSPHDRFASSGQLRETLASYLAHLQNPLQCRIPRALTTGKRKVWAIAAISATIFALTLLTHFSDSTKGQQTTSPATTTTGKVNEYSNPEQSIARTHTIDPAIEKLAHDINRIESQWEIGVPYEAVSFDSWSELHREIEMQMGETEVSWLNSDDGGWRKATASQPRSER